VIIESIRMFEDPRAALGTFIWFWMVYGFKGIRYLLSRKYRSRVDQYWSNHPERRPRNIRGMAIGVILDAGITALIVLLLIHR
jgi:hypothetical protein